MYNKLFQDKTINESGQSRISPEREQIEKNKEERERIEREQQNNELLGSIMNSI